MQEHDCLTVLCTDEHGMYRVWSDIDERVYTMSGADLEHERNNNGAEVVGQHDL